MKKSVMDYKQLAEWILKEVDFYEKDTSIKYEDLLERIENKVKG